MIVPQLPQYSPKASVEQVIGITEVKVTYARPSAKGRSIFGELVPHEQLWRTAANAGSYIRFDGPVTIEGTTVPAGEYALLTVPGRDHWQVMLNTSLRSILAAPHDPQQDVFRASVPVEAHPFTETFTIAFDHLGVDRAVLSIFWENTRVALQLEAPCTEQALRNVDEAIAQSDVTPGVLHSCAAFCLDRRVRLAEALTWEERSVELEPKFFSLRTLSLLYAANGRKREAIAAAKRSIELSKAAKQEAFVRLNEAKLREWEAEPVA